MIIIIFLIYFIITGLYSVWVYQVVGKFLVQNKVYAKGVMMSEEQIVKDSWNLFMFGWILWPLATWGHMSLPRNKKS